MPPKSAKKKGGSAKGAKGKMEVTLNTPEGEQIPVEALLTDTVAQLKVAVQKALDTKNCEDEEKLAELEQSREERSKGIELLHKGVLLEDLEAICQAIEIVGESEITMNPPKPKNGTGKFKFANKAVYEGEWQLFDGVKTRHGQGVFTQCGEVCEGQWVKDKISGEGKYIFNSGATYEGLFADAKFMGQGTYTWPDSSSYAGEWVDNVMEGTGTFQTASGDRYQGKFSKNQFLNDQGHWLPVPHKINYI